MSLDLTSFADTLRRISWFAAVGRPLTDAETNATRDYVAALGLADATLAIARDWDAAEAATQSPDWNPAWWDAEERERLALLEPLMAAHGEPAVMRALTHVTDTATRLTLVAASDAAARHGVADPFLTRVAAGAATQAAYQAALARLAGAADAHAFLVKFRLFAGGRWPLGLVGNKFHLF